MSDAVKVLGSTMGWGTTQGTYTAIPEVKAPTIPEVSTEYVDVTNLDSPNGFREFVSSLRDGGEIVLSCNYTPGLYQTAKGYEDNGTLVYFEVQLPLAPSQSTTGDKFEFAGLVTASMPQPDIAGVYMMDIKIRVSGNVTPTAGS